MTNRLDEHRDIQEGPGAPKPAESWAIVGPGASASARRTQGRERWWLAATPRLAGEAVERRT